jgi:hypothetical protein
MSRTVTFPGGKTVTFLNGGKKSSTLKALAKLKRKAKGKDKLAIARLEHGLKTNPAARSRRKSTGVTVKKHHYAPARRKVHASRHATTHRKMRRNPTRAAIIPFGAPRRRRKSNAGLFGKSRSVVKGLNLKGLFLQGAGVAAGMLASNAVSTQVSTMLPSLGTIARSGASSFIVAGLGYFLGKAQKDVGNGMIVGAIGEFIRTLGHEYAPSVFAGVPALSGRRTLAGGVGMWDPRTGTFLQGLQRAPVGTRPSLAGTVWNPAHQALPAVGQMF